MIRVSIILVNWNGKKDTIECLASLEKFKVTSLKLKVVVVDNGSTDYSVSAIKKNFSEVDVIECNQNLGFAGGNNIGIRRAIDWGADYIWLLNNDTVADNNALGALLDVFSDKSVGVAGSKIYFSPGHEFHNARYVEKERGHVLWYAGGLIDWKNMYASHRGVDEVDNGQFDITEETPFVTGCSMMVKREIFKKIGVFDEKFFAYLEDVDFCLRAKQFGYKLIYAPKSILWHNNAGSSGVGSDLHQYYMTRNRLLIGMRYAPLRTKLALFREGVGFIFNGPSIRRTAIIDGLLGTYGKKNI